MLICFDSDSELITPVSTSVNHLENGTEYKNNTNIRTDTQANVTVYEAKLPETMGWTMTIPITIKGKRISAVVDTAAQATIISEELLKNLNIPVQSNSSIGVRGVGHIQTEGKLLSQLTIQVGKNHYPVDMLVMDTTDPFIVGLDFLKSVGAVLDINANIVMIGDEVIPATMKRNLSNEEVVICRVKLCRKTTIPPNSGRMLKCHMDNATTGDFAIEPVHRHKQVWIPDSVVNGGNIINICVMNLTDKPVTIPAKELLACATEISGQSEGISSNMVPNQDIDVHSEEGSKTDMVTDQPVTLSVSHSVPPNSENSVDNQALCQSRLSTEITDCLLDMPNDETELTKLDTELMPSQALCQSRLTSSPSIGTPLSSITAKHELEEDDCWKTAPHVQELYQRSIVQLNESESEVLKTLLLDYEDVFAKHDLDLGNYTATTHRIHTGDAAPVKMRMRRTPLGFQKEEETLLQSMLEQGIIQPSESEWAAAPVIVRKRCGGLRYCVDFRKLNSVTQKDAFPIPLIEECLDNLEGNQYFSTLDMASGYWQINVEPEDRHKTAFITRYGLFEHVRMAQGLCNAPATYQRAMNRILKGMVWKNVLAYLDDVIVLGKEFQDHIDNLQQTLDRFRTYKMKLKPRKCVLFQREVEFLGRKVGCEGVGITQSKIETVLNWPVPSNKTEVESFLGFVNYHRDFVPDFAKKASSLYELTGSNKTFNWSDNQQEAFETLKKSMITAPVLAYPNSYDTFILDTDASNLAVGAELLQLQDGVERTIAYGSHILTPAQKKYCTTRKELLAVVTFLNQFRFYLLGKPFVVRTDHNSLTWLMSFKYTEGQLARWLEVVSQFDMKILHRPGKLHNNADGLSRMNLSGEQCHYYETGRDLATLPCGGCRYCTKLHASWDRFESHIDDVTPLVVRCVDVSPTVDFDEASWADIRSKTQLREEQLDDADIKPVFMWLENCEEPSPNELYNHGIATKHLWSHKDRLKIRDGVLYYEWVTDGGSRRRLKLVVPKSMTEEVLRLSHDIKSACHPGQKETDTRVRRSFFWHGMGTDSRLYVSTCATCNKNKKPRVKPKAAMQNYHAGIPMERIHLDILGPFPLSESGNKYVLVMVDQFTKWIELKALPNQTAEIVANVTVTEFISRMGCADQIFTDQGRNFDGTLFQSLCNLLEMAKCRTTPYRPSSNGQVERKNREILNKIRCYLGTQQKHWDNELCIIGMALRATVNRTTGFTPNMMMLGREVTLPSELTTGISLINQSQLEPAEHVKKLRDTLHAVHNFARDKLKGNLHYQKHSHDKKLLERRYQVGDLVYLLGGVAKVGESRKLKPVYTGPFIVCQFYPPVLYNIRGRRRDKSKVVHHDRLRLCNDRFIPLWARRERQKILKSDDTLLYDDNELDLTLIRTAEREAESTNDDVRSQKSGEDTSPHLPTLPPIHSSRGRAITKPLRYNDYEL